jgi:hypothetical protein
MPEQVPIRFLCHFFFLKAQFFISEEFFDILSLFALCLFLHSVPDWPKSILQDRLWKLDVGAASSVVGRCDPTKAMPGTHCLRSCNTVDPRQRV